MKVRLYCEDIESKSSCNLIVLNVACHSELASKRKSLRSPVKESKWYFECILGYLQINIKKSTVPSSSPKVLSEVTPWTDYRRCTHKCCTLFLKYVTKNIAKFLIHRVTVKTHIFL